jgi:hypothetical protein
MSVDFDLGSGKDVHAQKMRFGKMLAAQRDRIFDGYRITFAGREKRVAKWRLVPVQRPA